MSHKDTQRESRHPERCSGLKFLCCFSTVLSQPSGQCPLSFPNAQLEMSHQRESTSKIRHSHFCHVLSYVFQLFFFFFSFFTHLLSPALFSSASPFSSPVSPPSIAATFFTYVPLFFSTTISPCQQCQLGPCGAEKIEPQIEQSISVRIRQCQTTPSLVVCIEHAHMHSYF